MDIRNIIYGSEIPTESYCDQPYIVKTDDNAWLCILTTGRGNEGEKGQHIVSMRSKDCGKTWQDITDIEPADGPEASYATAIKASDGRLYCFYNHNTDNIRKVKAEPKYYPDGYCKRVDSLGHFVFKYSDANGLKWSNKRYEIPQRTMDIDRHNPYKGNLKFFWNVGKPFVYESAVYVPLHKVGGFGKNFFTRTEGVLLKSHNLLSEKDADKIEWETLPRGEFGLKTPDGGGPIAEEQSFAVLSDGTFFSVYRTIDGHPVCAYSDNRGESWSNPEYMKYADGRIIKHPRAANFVWKLKNGKYLYWFHNHGGKDCRDRNPVWLCAGEEKTTPYGKRIVWSQPEIILYDDDPYIGISYPDLVEDKSGYYISETQKSIARVHRLDDGILEALFKQFDRNNIFVVKPLFSYKISGKHNMEMIEIPELPRFSDLDYTRIDYAKNDLRQGFSIEIIAEVKEPFAQGAIWDTRNDDGSGIAIKTTKNGTIEILLSDGITQNSWECDKDLLGIGKHHLVITVDGGPKIITFVVDGRLCDGGNYRQFGWGRFSPNLRHVNGKIEITMPKRSDFVINELNIYDCAIKTSESVMLFMQSGVCDDV